MFKDLLFAAHAMGLNLRFTPVGSEEYEQWVSEQGQPKHLVTLLGRRINAGHIAQVAAVVAELSTSRSSRMTSFAAIITWEQPAYRDAQGPLQSWHEEAARAKWASPQQIKAQYRSASICANNRVVFNIGGNKSSTTRSVRRTPSTLSSSEDLGVRHCASSHR